MTTVCMFTNSHGFGKSIKTQGGLRAIMISKAELDSHIDEIESNPRWFKPYDSNMLKIHIANCGSCFIDPVTMTAIDDEYILDEIYNELKSHENV